jgi:hypothetical protein
MLGKDRRRAVRKLCGMTGSATHQKEKECIIDNSLDEKETIPEDVFLGNLTQCSIHYRWF